MPEVVAMVKRGNIGIPQEGLLAKLPLEELLSRAQWAIAEPADQSEGKHILASEG